MSVAPPTGGTGTAADLYLELLRRVLTRYEFAQPAVPLVPYGGRVRRSAMAVATTLLARRRLALVKERDWDPSWRLDGRDQPPDAETMIGLRRLESLGACIVDVLKNDVTGDLIETGVWRGGATIYMRAVLKVHGDATRTVWAADSFAGLPKPDEKRYPMDRGDRHWMIPELVVSLDQVRANFARYNLLDDRVRFLPGWFRDTLPSAPIDRLSVIRLDGDMYESTMTAIRSLYPKLSVGGYVIVDDYGAIPGCRAAIDEFREEHAITDPITKVDWTGVFWQRAS